MAKVALLLGFGGLVFGMILMPYDVNIIVDIGPTVHIEAGCCTDQHFELSFRSASH